MKIRDTRKNFGLTQKKMANLLGMTTSMVGKIETGVEGRSETKGHISHLISLELLAEHGLIDKLVTRIKKNKEK